jgi:hypothetical protein
LSMSRAASTTCWIATARALPVQFHISNDRGLHPIDAQVVQAATKWKRIALKQFDCKVGEGICTDMRAVRKDYFLDHDHSAYVDQWDWERVDPSAKHRKVDILERDCAEDLEGAGRSREICPGPVSLPLKRLRAIPNLPEELVLPASRGNSRHVSPSFPVSGAKPRFCRNIRPCLSSASAGH